MQIKCTCGHIDDWSRFECESYLQNLWQCRRCGRRFTLRGASVNTIITENGVISAGKEKDHADQRGDHQP